jgi:hypothetical protein
MRIFNELKRVTKHLRTKPACWAVCGGIAASLYRDLPRFTADIDIAIIDTPELAAKEFAWAVLSEMGYQPKVGFVPDPAGGRKQRAALICAREDSTQMFSGIDFLLPVFPWVPDAVARAQSNVIDYGFAALPTITEEDLLVAKITAMRDSVRPQDEDDVRSVLRHSKGLDGNYVQRQCKRFETPIPKWISDALT